MKVCFEPKDDRLGMQAENDTDLKTFGAVESYLVKRGRTQPIVERGEVVRPTENGIARKTNLLALNLELL